jgi:ribonucleoside-diphosphate reductase alpha chain
MARRHELQISQNARKVLERRYLQKDSQGRVIESPEDMFNRVARFIAAADQNYGVDEETVRQTADQFLQIMSSFEFVPNSPTLMNAGRKLGQLSACFVLPVGDSMEGIFDAIKYAALIHKSGGGTGFSFSRLRPRNSVVASTHGVASGPVSFMKVFNSATEAVKQGGTRRGANMGVLRVDHPDIQEFVSCKAQTSEVTNFNISVAATREFMEAVRDETTYALVDPHTGRVHRKDGEEVELDAGEVFNQIVDQAWQTGEPGLAFIDRMNEANPTDETIEATNPCGEQPLPPFDSCNLGSINLGLMVHDPLPDNYSPDHAQDGINWDRLGTVVRHAIHFLDNVIDRNKYPLPQIEEQTKRNRRVGLGVMGWADLLVKLRLPYNDDRAVELAERVMSFIEERARNHSSELAKTRGKFPGWSSSKYAEDEIAMRNATVTTVAPTGTISIIAGCSSGIEPYYAVAFERNVMDGDRLVEMNPLFESVARERGFWSDGLKDKVASRRSIADIEEIPDDVRAVFLTAADISPEDHIRMQAAFQRHTDSSVSKTINFAESATRDDVRDAFLFAWEQGCKGVTVYRDGSRPHQVLSSGDRKKRAEDESEAGEEQARRQVQERPDILRGSTEKIRTGYGNLYVTVNFKDNKPFEVFAQIGHSGYSTMADTEAVCRLISLGLRSGVPADQIVRQLRGIGGSSPVFSKGTKVTSIPDAIAQVLSRHLDATGSDENNLLSGDFCPDCGCPMVAESGCHLCRSCGYSSC